MKSPIRRGVSTVIASRAKPVMQAAGWLTALTNFVRLKWVSELDGTSSVSLICLSSLLYQDGTLAGTPQATH